MSYIFPCIEVIAALIGSWHLRKLVHLHEKLFLVFLWVTVLIETLTPLLYDLAEIDISWIYPKFTVASFLFYFYWYANVLKTTVGKRLVKILAIAFLVVTLWVEFNIEVYGGKGFAFVSGAIAILSLACLHFYYLLRTDRVLVVKHRLSFWVSTALLLFYVGILPLMLLSEYLGVEDLGYFVILVSLNIILYGCFSIGFIWMKRE